MQKGEPPTRLSGYGNDRHGGAMDIKSQSCHYVLLDWQPIERVLALAVLAACSISLLFGQHNSSHVAASGWCWLERYA